MTRRTVRLRVECPKCGARPAVQAYPFAAELLEGAAPDTPVLTVQCPRKTCLHIFDVTAEAFQLAS